MRIFTVIRHASSPDRYYSSLWSNNFYPALRAMGHEIVESQVDLLPVSQFMHIGSAFTAEELEERASITQRILEEVQSAHRQRPVDLFLSYFYNAHFEPGGFDEIHRLGIPTVNFFCNSVYQFELVAAIAPKASFAWHPEKGARQSYLAAGANPVWVQMGADPGVYRPLAATAREKSACFVGMRYADRDRWIAALIRAQLPVAIYGQGWGRPRDGCKTDSPPPSSYLGRRVIPAGSARSYAAALQRSLKREGIIRGVASAAQRIQYRRETQALSRLIAPHARGVVPAGEISSIISCHEVILNFSNVWASGHPGSALVPHVRLRDFEVPMCRGCYFTGHSDEIGEFYEPDREIITYRTPDELIEKVRFYLEHPEPAEIVRQAGYRRARREHTWERRFEELFQKIGLIG